MNNKILAAIEESLPQMQVEAIRKALEELAMLKEENKTLKDQVADYRKSIAEAITDAGKVADENDKLSSEIRELKERNETLEEESVVNRVAVIQSRLDGVESTTDKFLKNTIYRESLQHQVVDEGTSIQNHYLPNGQMQAMPMPFKTNKTVTDVKTAGNDMEANPGSADGSR